MRICKIEINSITAYLLGVYYGDGSIYHNPKKTKGYIIELQVKDRDFIDIFSSKINSLLNKKPNIRLRVRKPDKRLGKYYQQTIWCARVCSKDLFYFLKDTKFSDIKFPEHRLEFIKGFVDSEGCVNITPKGYAQIRMYGTNIGLLKNLKKWLKTIGIKVNFHKKLYAYSYSFGKKPMGQLVIYRRDLIERFAKLINFNIGRKKEILNNWVKEGVIV